MASQYMRQTVTITRKRGLSALLDRFFPDEEDDNKKKKKAKGIKDVMLKEKEEDNGEKKLSQL